MQWRRGQEGKGWLQKVIDAASEGERCRVIRRMVEVMN
jgi:hypothetical protein